MPGRLPAGILVGILLKPASGRAGSRLPGTNTTRCGGLGWFCRIEASDVPSVGMKLDAVDSFASRHHGLISRQRARSMGVSDSSWYRAIAAQQLEQIHPNVARLWGSPETFEQRALAAVWGAGEGSLTSHRTSSSLWNVPRPETDPIDLILASRAREARLVGVVTHHPRDRLDLRPIMRRGIPTTNPMRMLLDLGAVDESTSMRAS
jgi:hypothetical protein